MKKIVIFLCLLVFAGCASWKSIPQEANNSNQYFDVSLHSQDFIAFDLKVKNKTNQNIKIDWSRTYFIDPSGSTGGHFTFGTESIWEDRNIAMPPTIIFPNTITKKTLYPIANRYWKRSWQWTYMDLGTNGIFLTILVDGKIIEEKLQVTFVVDKEKEKTSEKKEI